MIIGNNACVDVWYGEVTYVGSLVCYLLAASILGQTFHLENINLEIANLLPDKKATTLRVL